MYLVQILLPLYDNRRRPIPQVHFTATAKALTERFGGVTAYTRAPAEGLWKSGRRARHDEIVVYEVMVSRFHKRWWRSQRQELENTFRQDEILIRAHEVMRI